MAICQKIVHKINRWYSSLKLKKVNWIKGRLKGLYDLVNYDSNNNLKDKLEEQKFSKHIKENSNRFCMRNRDKFLEHKECFINCPRYNPCPICDKCQNKASNLYVKCQICMIPICIHKYNDRKFMIRRENFRIKPNDKIKNNIKKIIESVKYGDID